MSAPDPKQTHHSMLSSIFRDSSIGCEAPRPLRHDPHILSLQLVMNIAKAIIRSKGNYRSLEDYSNKQRAEYERERPSLVAKLIKHIGSV